MAQPFSYTAGPNERFRSATLNIPISTNNDSSSDNCTKAEQIKKKPIPTPRKSLTSASSLDKEREFPTPCPRLKKLSLTDNPSLSEKPNIPSSSKISESYYYYPDDDNVYSVPLGIESPPCVPPLKPYVEIDLESQMKENVNDIDPPYIPNKDDPKETKKITSVIEKSKKVLKKINDKLKSVITEKSDQFETKFYEENKSESSES